MGVSAAAGRAEWGPMPRSGPLPVPRAVEVVEVAPRDGLQNEAAVLPTAAKLRLITGLVAAGARRIEATSFVHPQAGSADGRRRGGRGGAAQG